MSAYFLFFFVINSPRHTTIEEHNYGIKLTKILKSNFFGDEETPMGNLYLKRN